MSQARPVEHDDLYRAVCGPQCAKAVLRGVLWTRSTSMPRTPESAEIDRGASGERR